MTGLPENYLKVDFFCFKTPFVEFLKLKKLTKGKFYKTFLIVMQQYAVFSLTYIRCLVKHFKALQGGVSQRGSTLSLIGSLTYN
jgi:hypothetical protein